MYYSGDYFLKIFVGIFLIIIVGGSMKYLVTIGLILLVIFIIFLIISFVVSVFFYSIVGVVMLLWKYTFPTVTVVLIIISVIKRDLTFFLYGEFILVTLEMILIVFEQLRRQIIKQ